VQTSRTLWFTEELLTTRGFTGSRILEGVPDNHNKRCGSRVINILSIEGTGILQTDVCRITGTDRLAVIPTCLVRRLIIENRVGTQASNDTTSEGKYVVRTGRIGARRTHGIVGKTNTAGNLERRN
jgi:hypothetical protein